MNKIYISLLMVIVVACGKSNTELSRVEQLPYYKDATFTPQWMTEKESLPSDFHQIPAFTLTNQLGQTITEKEVMDKIYVADFFFTACPGICPKMTANMARIQEAFKEDEEVLLLSHSVTPEYDSIPVLKRYAKIKGVIDYKWHLLTGKRKDIYDLGRNFYFVEEDLGVEKDEGDFLHTENFVLIDQNRHIRGIYSGLNKTAVQQLITDIKTLKRG